MEYNIMYGTLTLFLVFIFEFFEENLKIRLTAWVIHCTDKWFVLIGRQLLINIVRRYFIMIYKFWVVWTIQTSLTCRLKLIHLRGTYCLYNLYTIQLYTMWYTNISCSTPIEKKKHLSLAINVTIYTFFYFHRVQKILLVQKNRRPFYWIFPYRWTIFLELKNILFTVDFPVG